MTALLTVSYCNSLYSVISSHPSIHLLLFSPILLPFSYVTFLSYLLSNLSKLFFISPFSLTICFYSLLFSPLFTLLFGLFFLLFPLSPFYLTSFNSNLTSLILPFSSFLSQLFSFFFPLSALFYFLLSPLSSTFYSPLFTTLLLFLPPHRLMQV